MGRLRRGERLPPLWESNRIGWQSPDSDLETSPVRIGIFILKLIPASPCSLETERQLQIIWIIRRGWPLTKGLMCWKKDSSQIHTWYLSIFLHGQHFWRIKFTPKKRVNYDKIHSKLPFFCVITAKYTVNFSRKKENIGHILLSIFGKM